MTGKQMILQANRTVMTAIIVSKIPISSNGFASLVRSSKSICPPGVFFEFSTATEGLTTLRGLG